jgi:hydrogenase maturation protease
VSGPHAAPGVPPLLRENGPRVWHLAPLAEAHGEEGPRVLIGGVGYWWQRDASFGLAAVEALAGRNWPTGVRVEKLDYGAIYVAQDLLAVDPPYERVVLVAGVERGREPGELYVSRWAGAELSPEELQVRIFEAGAGVIDLDHLLLIARHFGALPEDVVLIELEPVDSEGGIELSPAAAARLEEVCDRVRREALASPAGATTR